MDMNNLVGSITNEDFILGLLLARGVETLGDVWEKSVDCSHCKFAKQCEAIGDYFEDIGKFLTCGQVINLLLGDIKAEDIK